MGAEALHILLVEDDSDIRSAVSELLEDAGYAVQTAAHGRAALERLRTGPMPDVILLDLMMPVMDGWALEAELDADPEAALIPLIILSADAQGTHEGRRGRPRSHLRKPIDIDELLTLLETVKAS